MQLPGRPEARMSSKIGAYPGTAINVEELEAGRSLFTHFDTVLRYS
jgi:hypothetical protein